MRERGLLGCFHCFFKQKVLHEIVLEFFLYHIQKNPSHHYLSWVGVSESHENQRMNELRFKSLPHGLVDIELEFIFDLNSVVSLFGRVVSFLHVDLVLHALGKNCLLRPSGEEPIRLLDFNFFYCVVYHLPYEGMLIRFR